MKTITYLLAMIGATYMILTLAGGLLAALGVG